MKSVCVCLREREKVVGEEVCRYLIRPKILEASRECSNQTFANVSQVKQKRVSPLQGGVNRLERTRCSDVGWGCPDGIADQRLFYCGARPFLTRDPSVWLYAGSR